MTNEVIAAIGDHQGAAGWDEHDAFGIIETAKVTDAVLGTRVPDQPGEIGQHSRIGNEFHDAVIAAVRDVHVVVHIHRDPVRFKETVGADDRIDAACHSGHGGSGEEHYRK